MAGGGFRCGWVCVGGYSCLSSCNSPQRARQHLSMYEIRPCICTARRLLMNLPNSESEMTWNDGYDGVFRTSETKEILCLAPSLLSSMLGKQHGHDSLEQSPAS